MCGGPTEILFLQGLSRWGVGRLDRDLHQTNLIPEPLYQRPF